MQTVAAYRATLWLPLVLALPAGVLLVLAGDRLQLGGPVGEVIAYGGDLTVVGPALVGVPYIMFAMCASAWSRGASIHQLRWALSAAPVIFVVFLALVWMVARFAMSGSFDASAFGTTALRLYGFVLVYGYVCVAVSHAIMRVLRARGHLESAV